MNYRFVINCQFAHSLLGHSFVHPIRIFERNEPKSSGTPSLPINHQGGIYDLAELHEILAELIFRDIRADATDEDFLRLVLLFSRNSSFWVDLWNERGRYR